MTEQQATDIINQLDAIRLFASALVAMLSIFWGDRTSVYLRSVSRANNWFKAAGDR